MANSPFDPTHEHIENCSQLQVACFTCAEPAYLRLVIQEAPAVLGLARYREIDEAHTRGLLVQALKGLKEAGDIDFDDIELLSGMIAAAECQAALLMPGAKDRSALKAAALDALDRIVGAFRPKRR